MLVSVIIPTYNSAQYISSAIESVLFQTYQNFEIIVIDDGSIDNTGEIVKSFNDTRINYIYQENAGPAAARNKGISNAKGEYIAFLDADDIWEKNKLETQINIFKLHDESGLVFTAFQVKYEGNSKIYTKKYKNYPTNYHRTKNLLINMVDEVLFPSTVMVKKSTLDKAGFFDIEIKTGEDWDLWLRLSIITNFYYIDDILVKRFRPKTSITSQIDLKYAEKCHLSLLTNFFDNNPEYNKYKSKALSAIYYDYSHGYLGRDKKNPSFKEGFSCLYKSFKYDTVSYFINLRRTKFLIKSILIFLAQLKNLNQA